MLFLVVPVTLWGMDGRTQEQVGALVKARRLELRISEKRLQAAAQVDAKTLKAIERGDRWPQEETRLKVEAELQWAPGSIADLRAGRRATPLPDPAAEPSVPPIQTLSDEELVAEILRRMKGERHAVESAPKSRASSEAIKAQEASGPAAGQHSQSWAPGWSSSEQGPRVGGDEDGEKGEQLRRR